MAICLKSFGLDGGIGIGLRVGGVGGRSFTSIKIYSRKILFCGVESIVAFLVVILILPLSLFFIVFLIMPLILSLIVLLSTFLILFLIVVSVLFLSSYTLLLLTIVPNSFFLVLLIPFVSIVVSSLTLLTEELSY
jgi:hypothetical protein